MRFVYDKKLGAMVPEHYLYNTNNNQSDLQIAMNEFLTKEMAEKYNYSTRSIAYEFKRTHEEFKDTDLNLIRNAAAIRNNEITSVANECDAGGLAGVGSAGIGSAITSSGSVDAISNPVLKKEKKSSKEGLTLKELNEVFDLAKEIGLGDKASDIQKFMERQYPEGNKPVLQALREYRAELGADFKIAEEATKIPLNNKEKQISPQITRNMPIIGTDGILATATESKKKDSYKYWLTYGDWEGSRVLIKFNEPVSKTKAEELAKEAGATLQENISGFSTLEEATDAANRMEENLTKAGEDKEQTKIIEVAVEAQQISLEGKGSGDCFVQALHNFQSSEEDKPLLVHGIITGQGKIEGILYNHAWVEIGDTVIDTTIPLFKDGFPREAYYNMARIQDNLIFKYDKEQVLNNLLKHKTYGPWENILWNYV